MNAFTNRERALEAKFQHDQMLQYKVISRRNRLFGLWAAQHLQYSSDQAESYAREVVGGIFSTLDGEVIIQKVLNDLAQNHVDISEHRTRRQLQYCHEDATVQILNE